MAPSRPNQEVLMEKSVAIPTKRKTPSELRAEQVKRLRTCGAASRVDDTTNVEYQKTGLPKQQKYIDTRVVDIYPITKFHEKFKGFTLKESPKSQTNTSEGLAAPNDNLEQTSKNSFITKGTTQKLEIRERNEFCNVAKLSSSSSNLPIGEVSDMTKAFKGLANSKTSSGISLSDNSSGNIKPDLSNEAVGLDKRIAGKKILLDLTLKASVRITSSSSLNWCLRLCNSSKCIGMKGFLSLSNQSLEQHNKRHDPDAQLQTDHSASLWQALHSWVYPQTVLPTSVISNMALLAARGSSTVEEDFLLQRQSDWQESFRSLYYMFRKGECSIFYVCTHQFVVMFICDEIIGKASNSRAAYMTRSTRGLRALLRQHEIEFSLPLVSMESDPMSTEDLRELSEFEKLNPGQTQVVDFMVNVDNTPQSLLAFIGSKNVHGIYDFLLNHRSLLSSVASVDVPLLYSAVPFQNASLHVPKVSYKELKTAEALLKPLPRSKTSVDQSVDSHSEKSSDITYSLEIKGGFLPPWVVSRFCGAFASTQKAFEVSFGTDPHTHGLNALLSLLDERTSNEEPSPISTISNGIFNDVTLHPYMQNAFVKNLSFANGLYTTLMSSV